MKLNKMLALALSGVMAVSMLAGCSGAPSNGEEGQEQPVVDTTVAGRVISAMDSKITDKVTFKSDAHLGDVLEAVVKNAGFDADKVDAAKLVAADPDLGKTSWLPEVGTVDDTEGKVQTVVKVVKLTDSSELGVSEEYAIKQLAAKFNNEQVADKNLLIEKLPEFTKDMSDDDGTYYYTFEYTGKVAVAQMKDAVTGLTGYVAAYTVTRTPTRVDK